MKPVKQFLSGPASAECKPTKYRWRVFVDALVVKTRVGIHPHEHLEPQSVVLDAILAYRCDPAEAGTHTMIDYERFCDRICAFLSTKPHTRLLETLAMEFAELSFCEWPVLEATHARVAQAEDS